MNDFDFERAAFWLLAVVIGVYVYTVLLGATMCALYFADIVSGKWQCDKDNRLSELLGAALSAVLAYLAGRRGGRNGKDNRGDEHDPR